MFSLVLETTLEQEIRGELLVLVARDVRLDNDVPRESERHELFAVPQHKQEKIMGGRRGLLDCFYRITTSR